MKKKDLNRQINDFGDSCGYIAIQSDGLAKQMTLLYFAARFSRTRASNVAITHFHSITQGGPRSRTLPEGGSITQTDAWCVKVLCTLFVRSSSLDVCFGYFSKHLTPSIAFEVIRRLDDPHLALNFYQFSRAHLNITHSFWTYNLLIRSLCQNGLHSSAKMVYDCMRSDGQLPDSSLLGFLVSSYAQVGKLDISKGLLAEAQRDKVGAHTFVYNDLFNVLVKQNRVDAAVSIFRDHMGSYSYPETCTFNILIRGLSRVGKLDKAFEFLKDMRSFDCFPDSITYNTLIHGLCRFGEVEKAMDLLKELCLSKEVAPDVVTYTTIISGYCRLQKMKEATFLFEEMMESGMKPNEFTFNVLIDGFNKVGDLASALAMREKMLSCGLYPDVVTFTSLIDGYCRVGQINHALTLWHEICARNVSPSLHTYSILINALCKSNRLSEARVFLSHLKCSKLVPKPFIYNPVVDGFSKSGNIQEANTIVEEMESTGCKPDKITFTILIIGHCMKGRMLEAIRIFHKMLALGCAPDNITMKCFIPCLLKAGMPRDAFHIQQALSEGLNSGVSSLKVVGHPRTKVDVPVAVY